MSKWVDELRRGCFMSGQAKQAHGEAVPMAMGGLTYPCIYRSSLASHLQARRLSESSYAI